MKVLIRKRLMSLIMSVCMIAGLLCAIAPTKAQAVDTGTAITADSTKWGAQDNNGWYYMYKLADGSYHEMNFYDSSDSIDWRKNAFASDLSTTQEMFFIQQGAVFYGENATRPVYAYKAPAAGEITLRMQTHSTTDMHMQVYVGGTLQQIGGADNLTLTQTGTLPGAMTLTELQLTVKKDQMVYVEFYSTNMSAQRQAWINEYSVVYNSINENEDPVDPAEELVGRIQSADVSKWGTQGNNGWYYMYKLADGTYHQMNFYDSSDDIDWRKNAFASDLSTTVEMFFIQQGAVFYGENATRPVFAYKAPAAGEITLRMQTHSTTDMHMQVYVGGTLQQIGGADSLTLTQTGTLSGAMTLTELQLTVKKDQMVYVEFYSTNMSAQRQAWINEYSVVYNSVSSGSGAAEPGEELIGVLQSADVSKWGTQANNGWYYMYKLADGTYHQMNFYDSSDDIDWRKNAFASDLSTTVEMFFIQQGAVFYGENATRPVFAYKAPAAGEITLRMQTHSTTDMHMQVYVGETLQQIGGADNLTLTQTGTLPGAMTLTELQLTVKKDQMVYVEFYSTNPDAQRQAWINEYSVVYNSVGVPADISDLMAIELGDAVTADFYITPDVIVGADEKVVFQVSLGGAAATEIEGALITEGENAGRYLIKLDNIYPQQFSDLITGRVIVKGTDPSAQPHVIRNYTTSDGLSIASYCDSLIAAYPDDETLRNLVANMLIYGEAAQLFADYRTDALPTEGRTWIEEAKKTFDIPSDTMAQTVIALGDKGRISGASLQLAEKVRMAFSVTAADTAEMSLRITFDGAAAAFALTDPAFTTIGTGVYRLILDKIMPADYGKVYKVELLSGENVIHAIDYSVNAYISRMQADTAAGTLIKALNDYGQAAVAYKAAHGDEGASGSLSKDHASISSYGAITGSYASAEVPFEKNSFFG